MKRLLILLSIVFSMVATNAYAQIEWQRFDYFSNAGGLNDAFSEVDIEDNEAADIQNIVFTTSGNIKTRDGFDNVNASTVGSTTATTAIQYYKQADGTEFLVSVWEDDKIRKMDYSGNAPDGTWDNIT